MELEGGGREREGAKAVIAAVKVESAATMGTAGAGAALGMVLHCYASDVFIPPIHLGPVRQCIPKLHKQGYKKNNKVEIS